MVNVSERESDRCRSVFSKQRLTARGIIIQLGGLQIYGVQVLPAAPSRPLSNPMMLRRGHCSCLWICWSFIDLGAQRLHQGNPGHAWVRPYSSRLGNQNETLTPLISDGESSRPRQGIDLGRLKVTLNAHR